MGSCLSVHKDPESAAEPRFSVPPASLVNTVNGGDHAVSDSAVKDELSSRFPNAGSKDDSFFDSQPWLESDGEDDFLSVNGDFTPSRGSTPLHHKFSSGNPTVNNTGSGLEERDGNLHELHNPDKKKRLSELFKESLRHQDSTDHENVASVKTEEVLSRDLSKSVNGVGKTHDGAIGAEGDGRVNSALCCFPSFSERKMKTSPVMVSS